MDKKFQNHIIICGLGSTAVQIIEELESYLEKPIENESIIGEVRFREYLVIESSGEAIDKMRAKWPNIHYLAGDATDDEVLEKACIRDAYGIFPVLSSEKDNLYITMAARQLNPRIRIVARTADVFNIGKKLFKGGANSVVSPNFIGGLRLISEIARPHATDFLDEMLRNKNTQLKIAEIVIYAHSALHGHSLKEACLPEQHGLLIIAIKKHGDSHYTYNPSYTVRLENADTIVVLGDRDQILEFKKQAAAV
ncbi:MAG: hypothetical protein DRG73_03295 [Deltaproteobacteria bacterium]|nr:MAG: hypothetical protein DRG73_03295 [Deltaproteobacteria bacterium]